MRRKLMILTVTGLLVFSNTICSNGGPDLTVKSIECREGRLFFTIANEGTGSLPDDWAALASIYIDGVIQEDVVLNESTATKDGGIQESGGISEYLTAFDVDKIIRVDLYVDYTKAIRESDEENNSAENVYIEPCDLPDLVIESVSLNEDCYVVVTIANQGKGSLPLSVWDGDSAENCGMTLFLNDQEWGKKNLWEIDLNRSLDMPGGSISYTSELKVDGQTDVTARIDVMDIVNESDEDNNKKISSLTCGNGKP
jgi:subtilase family serine protease